MELNWLGPFKFNCSSFPGHTLSTSVATLPPPGSKATPRQDTRLVEVLLRPGTCHKKGQKSESYLVQKNPILSSWWVVSCAGNSCQQVDSLGAPEKATSRINPTTMYSEKAP